MSDVGCQALGPSKAFVGHSERVWCVELVGGVAATGGGDVAVKLWDASTGQCTHTLAAPECAAVVAVHLALPAVYFAAGARVFAVNSSSLPLAPPAAVTAPTSQGALVLCMAVSGPLIYAGYQDNVIRVWKNGVCKGRYAGHTGEVRCLKLVGHAMYSGSEDQTVIRWNTNTAKPSVLFKGANGPIRDLVAHNDELYLANGTFVRVQKISSGNLVCNLAGHSDVVVTLALDAVSGILYSGGADRRIAVWRAGQLVGCFQPPQPDIVKALRLHNGCLFAAVANAVLAWEVTTIAAALGTSQIAAAVDVLAQLTYSDQFGFASGDDIDGVGFANALLGGTSSDNFDDTTLIELTMAFPAPPTDRKSPPPPLPRPKSNAAAAAASPATLPRAPRPQLATAKSVAAPPPAAASRPMPLQRTPSLPVGATTRALPALPADFDAGDAATSAVPLRRPLPPGEPVTSPPTSPVVPRPLPQTAAFASPPLSPALSPVGSPRRPLPPDEQPTARPLPPLVTSPPTLRRPLPQQAMPQPHTPPSSPPHDWEQQQQQQQRMPAPLPRPPYVFDCWLLGMSPASIADERQRQRHNVSVSHALLLADSEDQCRSMGMLERYLRNAQQLNQQSLFQLDLDEQRRLVEKYYALHDPLMRELAGRKLTSYLYKSLGDVAERLRVPQHLCERNFDNLRRVYKRVLDCVDAGQAVLPTLERHYLLSDELAARYVRACYARFHRWELSKKKLSPVSVADLEYFASVQMDLWTREPNPLELDAAFKAALREHRTALLNDKALMAAYVARVSATLQPLVAKPLASKLESKLVPLVVKPLLQVAIDLSSAKQFRDFPLDLLDNFAVPLRKFGINKRECELVLTAFAQASLSREFARFIQGVALCVIRIF